MELKIRVMTTDNGQPLPYPQHSYWVPPELLDEARSYAGRFAARSARQVVGDVQLEMARPSTEFPGVVELTFVADTVAA